MTSPSENERLPFDFDRPEPSLLKGSVSDFIARIQGRDVSGVRFVSLDEPDEPLEPEMPPAVEVREDEQQREEEARREAERMRVAAEAAAAQELQASLESVRAEALAEARRGFEMELEMKLVEERKRLDRLRIEFARDRQRFFAAAESQVVKLALAVARKILHRDAATEGLPLRATVKAALARVQDGSSTVLRVPVGEVEAWTAMFQRGTVAKVDVIGDEQMVEGECVLETNVGRVELGEDAQMEEIERGFGELMQEQGY